MKLALTGDVALELIAPYFREAGYEILPQDALARGELPEITYDVTEKERELAAEIDGFYDERMRKLAGCRFSRAGIQALVEEFGWKMCSRRQKVLAVDADNTLWRGILSEDGVEALVPCAEFQQGLRSLADEGVILVLLSKNDPGSIEELLRRRHAACAWLHDSFASCRVNWEPKAGNLIEACRALNVGVDSVVFVDDNPHERAQMAAHLPEVLVAPWHGWNSAQGNVKAERQLLRRLREYFFYGRVTAEDRLRTADYRRSRLVAALSSNPSSPPSAAMRLDYLRSLGLWVEPRPAEERDLDRLAQMAGKTNQFNATTKRRTRAEFAELLAGSSSPHSASSTYVFRAGDRFGEQGIVCYVIVDRTARRITDFVMSCRAMGRTLEYFVYQWISARLGYEPELDFVPSAKNAPFKAFLESDKHQWNGYAEKSGPEGAAEEGCQG